MGNELKQAQQKMGFIAVVLMMMLIASVFGDDKADVGCGIRQVGLDFAYSLQGWRDEEYWKDFVDALEGAPDFPQGCVLKAQPSQERDRRPKRVVRDVRYTERATLSLEDALHGIRKHRLAHGMPTGGRVDRIVLQSRVIYRLQKPLQLDARDSSLIFESDDEGSVAWISGAVLLNTTSWQREERPLRPPYEMRRGSLNGSGDSKFDVIGPGMFSLADAQSACDSVSSCAGFDMNTTNPGALAWTTFKWATFWVPADATHVSYFKNFGYGEKDPPAQLFSTKVNMAGRDIQSIRLPGGRRGIRARYPNVRTAELLGAMQVLATSWTPQEAPPVADYTFSPKWPLRNDTVADRHVTTLFVLFYSPNY